MIRPATTADIPRIVELGASLHAESCYRDRHWNEDKVRTLMFALITGAGVVFVAERDGLVVGGIAGAVAPDWFGDDLRGFDYSLFLLPEARHGYTTLRLVTALEQWCRARGAKSMTLGISTGINVEGLSKLYRFMGYADNWPLFRKEL